MVEIRGESGDWLETKKKSSCRLTLHPELAGVSCRANPSLTALNDTLLCGIASKLKAATKGETNVRTNLVLFALGSQTSVRTHISSLGPVPCRSRWCSVAPGELPSHSTVSWRTLMCSGCLSTGLMQYFQEYCAVCHSVTSTSPLLSLPPSPEINSRSGASANTFRPSDETKNGSCLSHTHNV